MNLSHQVSCSALLAAAVTEFFPKARLKSFQATETCFFCDVVLPFKFEKEALPLLEERMRAWVKKNISFQILEMMPANAAQFLEHHGYPTVAKALEGTMDLVQILRLDSFVGIVSERPLDSTGDIKLFKLLLSTEQGGITRILGTSATSKEHLKANIEQCKKIVNHLPLALELQLISDDIIWLPRGEILKNLLITRVLNFPGIDPISTPALEESQVTAFHAKYCRKTQRGAWECVKRALGGRGDDLLDPMIGTADQISLPLNAASITSFLHIIAEFFKIVPFDARVVSVGKPAKMLKESVGQQFKKIATERGSRTGIEFRCQDSLGREWTGPRMWTEDKAGLVVLSLFHSLERLTALLLEKTGGALPFVFQPEQLRVVGLDNSSYAEEVADIVRKAGFRVGMDKTERPLQQRLASALRERVPFSIVIGDRESQSQRFAVREADMKETAQMNIETLINRLRQVESQ